MAAKRAATKRNTSLVANPGGSSPVAKAKSAKTNPARRRGGTKHSKTTTHIKRKTVRRNPTTSHLMNTLIAAFGGALGITGFDYAVNYFAPNVSGTIKMAAKFGTAWLLGAYGKKLPVIGSYATGISNTLYVFAFVDLIANHALPLVMPYLPQRMSAAPAAPQIVQTASGEMGALIDMPDGSQAVLIDETGAIDRGGSSYGNSNYSYGYN